MVFVTNVFVLYPKTWAVCPGTLLIECNENTLSTETFKYVKYVSIKCLSSEI